MMKFWMAPGGMHIEPGRSNDAQALERIHIAGFYQGWSSAEFECFLHDPATPVYVACDARRRICGFALIRLAADEVELLTIVVEPKWRGKHIGQALLRAIFKDLLFTAARRMFLEVSQDNVPAIRFYEQEGFTRVGARQGYYAKADGSSATALVMARDLE